MKFKKQPKQKKQKLAPGPAPDAPARPAPPGDAPADAPFTGAKIRELVDLIEAPASPLLAEPPPSLPIEPGAGVLLRKRPEIPQHLVLKPHQCPRCRAAMAVYGNFGVCGCGYKGKIA